MYPTFNNVRAEPLNLARINIYCWLIFENQVKFQCTYTSAPHFPVCKHVNRVTSTPATIHTGDSDYQPVNPSLVRSTLQLIWLEIGNLTLSLGLPNKGFAIIIIFSNKLCPLVSHLIDMKTPKYHGCTIFPLREIQQTCQTQLLRLKWVFGLTNKS